MTLYFGPTALVCLEANGISTSGMKSYAMFRFYDPEASLQDKFCKLADIQKAK